MRRLALLVMLLAACGDVESTCPGHLATQIVRRDDALPWLEASTIEGRTLLRLSGLTDAETLLAGPCDEPAIHLADRSLVLMRDRLARPELDASLRR